MKLKSIKNVKNLKNKKILLRVNFDCPVKNGRLLDETRIQAVLPTIKYLMNKGAKVILISHLGRPLGNKKLNIKNEKYKSETQKQYTLKPLYNHLKKILKHKARVINLKFVNDCIGSKVEGALGKMNSGDVVLLENLRFYAGEETNNPKFAEQLASLADIYVNDAFPVCHRRHASVNAITRYLPSYAGFNLEEEIKNLSDFLRKPSRPFVALIGGAKISTKIGLIRNLAKVADYVLLGGALANNFLVAGGYNVGESTYEPKMLGLSKKLIKNKKIILPADVRVKLKVKNQKLKAQIKNIKINKLAELADNFRILDIGEGTIRLFSQYVKNAKMIIWNGPLGYFEDKNFNQGTMAMARRISKNREARIAIGGGETIAALTQLTSYPINRLSNLFISTGGGAMLEFLEGKILPGIKPLITSNKR